jgi:DNA-binding MarR family transcriptional regulator
MRNINRHTAVSTQPNTKNTPAPEGEGYDLQILQSLRKIIRSVDIHSRKLSTKHDITAPQLITLLALVEHGPLTVAAIAKEIHLSSSTLVGIIDRLEAKSYVSRERSIQDRRQVIITPTDKGIRFAAEAPSPLQETLATALNELPLTEQIAISHALERVVELMEAKEIDAAPILQAGAIEGK